jgi:hypothetical protein
MVTHIQREELNLGWTSSIVLSRNGKRVYQGRSSSYRRDRMNLGVISIDSTGSRVEKVEFFKDCTDEFELPLGANTSVTKIIPVDFGSESRKKLLYLITQQREDPGLYKWAE